MKIIKVKHTAHHGKKLNVPVDGHVDVSKDGTIEVSDEAANHLLTLESEFEEVAPKKVENEKKNEGDDDGLNSLLLEDLVELAKTSGYEEKEYKKFAKNKKLMIVFLRKKADEKLLDESEESDDDDESDDAK